ncbi:ribosome maturation factor RimP [Phormidesmis sp. 146-35]
MAHPLIPQILNLAAPVAESLGLEVVAAVFQTNQSPPVLRVDVRNKQDDTGLEDCEQMSRALEVALDETEMMPEAYVLEVSSPGISRSLTTDREFTSFRGFPAIISTSAPHQGQTEWTGNLIKRDEKAVYLSLKGRTIAIPRELVDKVLLAEGEE